MNKDRGTIARLLCGLNGAIVKRRINGCIERGAEHAAAQIAAAAQSKAIDSPHDGDGDDVAAAPVQAAPAPGTGLAVD